MYFQYFLIGEKYLMKKVTLHFQLFFYKNNHFIITIVTTHLENVNLSYLCILYDAILLLPILIHYTLQTTLRKKCIV